GPVAQKFAMALGTAAAQPWPSILPQLPNPGVQAEMTPAEALQPATAWGSGGQAEPHPPQLLESLAESVSQPLAALLSQLLNPMLQAESVQPPPMQAAMALGRLHALPQAPQLRVSLSRLASQPFFAAWSQSA